MQFFFSLWHSAFPIFPCLSCDRTCFIFPQIVRLYPPDLPPTVVSPLLTDTAVQLLDRVVSEDEEYLWRSLGDCWFTPR